MSQKVFRAPSKSWNNLDVPRMEDGKTFHLGLKEGQLSNRILTVGDKKRALNIATHLESCTEAIESSRGFTTITGTFEGVEVSIVAIGMGVSMMDFFVREARAIVHTPMVIIRYGTCGVLVENVSVGTAMVAEASCLIQNNPDAVEDGGERYRISKPIPADPAVVEQLVKAFEGVMPVCRGTNCTADSFYSSQGRLGAHFNDGNTTLLGTILERVPNVSSMEMETGQLLHLCRLSKDNFIRGGAACVGVMNRITDAVIDVDALHRAEVDGGRAVLRALVRVPPPEGGSPPVA